MAIVMNIHPTAVIDKGAELDSTVKIGPYCVIENGVSIGSDTEIGSHVVISGCVDIGARNKIGPFSTIGLPPQDLKYKNEETKVVIGDDNIIREYVSLHRGTPEGKEVTTIGNSNLLMAYCHIAHDCSIGNYVILANAATLGGHVDIEDRVTVGGLVAVHQFSRIGAFSYIGGLSGISKDVPPYMIISGIRNQMRVTGINRIGLKRCGFDTETIRKLTKAFQIIFRTPGLLLQDALSKSLQEIPDCEPVSHLVQFFKTSSRGVVRASSDDE